MNNVSVNFKKADGKIRHVNATNNGPAGSRVRMTGNFKNYQELEIPYARLHDSAFYAANYGGEYAVDVHRVFPNFDADENDPASYLFKPTDSYLEDIVSVGTKIYYRLGASIEHGYKRGTYPPKDFLKWAKICEHIIRHYTEGWADGYNHDIEYWEIWNEFDCKNHDGSNPCWQGTNEEYYDFYCTVSAYLKSKFPHLKIGGPALCSFNEPVIKAFLNEVKSRGAALDFFSYHWYGCTVESFVNIIRNVNRVLDDCGFSNMETHINEWNYIRGWLGEEYTYSMNTIIGAKGAAFVSAIMTAAQKEKLDMLMYYDARPSGFNGIFANYGNVHNSFYTFKAAKEIKRLSNSVYTECDENLYAMAATDNTDSALLLTYFNDDDSSEDKIVKIEIDGAKTADCVKAQTYLIDANHNLSLVREEYFTAEKFSIIAKMKNYDTYLIKISKADFT